jgi:hypothetical protein
MLRTDIVVIIFKLVAIATKNRFRISIQEHVAVEGNEFGSPTSSLVECSLLVDESKMFVSKHVGAMFVLPLCVLLLLLKKRHVREQFFWRENTYHLNA